MRDQPLAVVLVETKRCAPPHVELSSACLRSVNMAEPEGEGHIIAHTTISYRLLSIGSSGGVPQKTKSDCGRLVDEIVGLAGKQPSGW